MQHWQHLRAVCIVSDFTITTLLKYLPHTITTLRCSANNVKELARLPNLTTLHLDSCDDLSGMERIAWQCFSGNGNTFPGMEHISGLTRLHCSRPLGCILHLAPTLKCLSIWGYKNVQGIDQLTNLEHLNISRGVPADFFQTQKQLPLKHFSMRPHVSGSKFVAFVNWAAAPTTLKHLTFFEDGGLEAWRNGATPDAGWYSMQRDYVEQATTALPSLTRLDLCFFDSNALVWDATWPVLNQAVQSLSRLSHLQLLSICVHRQGCMPRQELIQLLPAIATTEARGVKVNVVETDEECSDLFWAHQGFTKRSAWAAPASTSVASSS